MALGSKSIKSSTEQREVYTAPGVSAQLQYGAEVVVDFLCFLAHPCTRYMGIFLMTVSMCLFFNLT